MIKIDATLLQDIGLGSLPTAEKDSLLKHIYETLEMRVGMRLADQMTNQQLDEFEQYFEAKDDAGAFKWLETNFPNYKDIVQEEFDKLKAEVTQSAPHILSASQTAQPQPIAAPAASQPVYPAPATDPAVTANQPLAAPMAPPTQASSNGPAAPQPAAPYQPDPNRPVPYPAPAPSPVFEPPAAPFTPPANQPAFPPQQPPAGPGQPYPPQAV